MVFRYLLFILISISCKTLVSGLWEGCDYYQELKLGEIYTISSPNYPKFYGTNPLSCRWTAKSPVGYIVAFSCYIEIPQVCTKPIKKCIGNEKLVITGCQL